MAFFTSDWPSQLVNANCSVSMAVMPPELFISFGPAVARYENTPGAFVGGNAGLGFRLYLTRAISLRAEIRDYEFVNPSQLSDNKNELFLQLGLGLNIR